MANTPHKPGSWLLKIVVVFGALLGAYFLYVEIQTRMGEEAREATGLESLSLEAGLAKAQAENKKVLVEYSAVWCPTCRALDRRVFAEPEVRKAIERHYVFVRIDHESDEGDAFREQYDVKGFPTILLLRPDGRLYRPIEVTMDPVEFLRRLIP